MGYSDLKEEEVKNYIEAIKDAELYTDLVLIEEEMIRKGKVNNIAFQFLQEEKKARREAKEGKSHGRK